MAKMTTVWLLLLLAMLGYSQHGNIAIMSGDSVVYEPFPSGPRTHIPHVNPSLELECSACDVGAPTEYFFPDLGVYVRLTDRNLVVIASNGAVRNVRPTNTGCTPRMLQMVGATTLAVTCQQPCFQIAMISGAELTVNIHLIQCSTGDSGFLVQDSNQNIFHITLAGNLVLRSDPFGGTHLTDITPHTNCTELLSLHPLFTRDEFILLCNTDTGARLYIVGVHEEFSDHSPPFVSANSTPISSPNGDTFAAVSGTTLLVYRTNNLAAYPGVKDLGQTISLCVYLDNATILVFLEHGQVLIHVNTFINSVGTRGLISVSCNAHSGVHKLIYADIYATSNQTGSLYNVLLYKAENGQLLKTVSHLREEPANVVFQPTTRPTLQPTASSTLLPTASSIFEQLPTATQVMTSVSPEISPSMKTSTHQLSPTNSPSTSPLSDPSHKHKNLICAVAVLAVIMLLAGIGLCALCIAYRYQTKLKEIYCFRMHDPIKKEEMLEKRGNDMLVISSSTQYSKIQRDCWSSGLPVEETNNS